jgi:cytochrome b561
MSNAANTRYHPLQVSLHWLIVILIFATFLLGKYMSGLPNESGKILSLGLHMTLGFLTLVVMVVRVIARRRLPQPVHVTAGSAFFDWIGRAVHYALYVLVFLMAVSGMSLSLQSGLIPIVFGGSGSPLPADFYEFNARMLHGFIGPALLILVGLHVGAVLYHQFILKDHLLARMGYGKSQSKELAETTQPETVTSKT